MTHLLSTHPSAAVTASSNGVRLRAAALSAGRFLLHFGEMWLAMMAGMLVFHALPLSHQLTGAPHQLGMAAFMTAPMVAWMRVRGHGWRHGIEMAIGMLLPWGAVLVLLALGAATALPWLAQAGDAAMLLGMLAAMLLRPGHYTHQHTVCHAPESASSSFDPVCGMAIDPSTATRTAEYEGQIYHFCAPACRKSFLADPARFLTPDYTPAM